MSNSNSPNGQTQTTEEGEWSEYGRNEGCRTFVLAISVFLSSVFWLGLVIWLCILLGPKIAPILEFFGPW